MASARAAPVRTGTAISTFAVSLFAFVLLLDIAALGFNVARVTRSAVLPPERMSPEIGAAFTAVLPGTRFPYPVVPVSDNLSRPFRSNFILKENGIALGPANAEHNRIRSAGRGAFSLWAGQLWFSSSDASDPRTNGKTYEGFYELELAGWVWSILALVNATVAFCRWRDLRALAIAISIRLLMLLSSAAHQTAIAANRSRTESEKLYWIAYSAAAQFAEWFTARRFDWVREVAVVVAIAILPTLIAVLLDRGYAIFAGSAFSTLPMRELGIRAIANGELPLWTHALGTGLPIMGDGISLPYDPTNVWWGVLPPAAAYVASILTGRSILMVAAYLYFRYRLELARGPALSALVVYFCGTLFVMEIGFSHLVGPLEALPALIWLSERLLDRPGWQRASHLALCWFGVLLISSAAYVVFLPFLVGAWISALWLFSLQERKVKSLAPVLAWYAAAQVWGLCLVGFALLPFIEMLSLSNRGTEYGNDPFALRSLWGLVMGPLVNHPTAVNPPYSFFYYVGVVALPLIASSLLRRDNRYLRALPLLSLLTLGGITLLSTPLKGWLAHNLSFLNTLAFFRVSFFWGFLAAALVGFALDQSRWAPTPLIRAGTTVLASFQGAILGLIVLAAAMTTIVSIELPDLRERVRGLIAEIPFALALAATFFAALRLAGLLLARRPGGPIRRTAIGTVLMAELLAFFAIFDWGPYSPFPQTPEVRYLRTHGSLDDRTMQILDFAGGGRYLHARRDEEVHALHLNALAWWPEVQTPTTYNSLMPVSYWQFLQALGDRPAPWRGAPAVAATERADSPLLAFLGVRWLVSRHELQPGPYFHRLTGAAYHIYERVDPMPRAYVVRRAIVLSDDSLIADVLRAIGAYELPAALLRGRVLISDNGAATTDGPAPLEHWGGDTALAAPPLSGDSFVAAKIVHAGGTRVTVEAETPGEGGWLVLADNHYPGWTASVNGKPAAIRKANLFARAVPLPAGRSTIEFVYWPESFRDGLALSAAAGVLLLVAFAAQLFPGGRMTRQDSRRRDQAA